MSCKEASDSIVIHYDYNKKDQKGETTSPKNCYANPFNPAVCMFLALGCYLCIDRDKFDRTSDDIFTKNGKDRSASDTYHKQLKSLIGLLPERARIILEFCREGHFHAHGTRKGAAMKVTTGTMEPPPMPSVLLRGEWSLGKVLDIYWQWSKLGDTYLGRLLAGLSPDKGDEFATLPPHFTEGMENVHIREAMQLCFGPIIAKWGHAGIMNVLLLLLASMVYHSEWLLGFVAGNSRHPFQGIPILQRPALLVELKKLVTLEEKGRVREATGVPYRVKETNMLRKAFETIQTGIDKLLERQEEMEEKIPQVIKDTIDLVARDAGQVTVPAVMELLHQHTGSLTSSIGEAVKDAVRDATRHLGIQTNNQTGQSQAQAETSVLRMGGVVLGRWREYNGMAVPPCFRFPSATLRQAWDSWLLGYPNNQSKKTNQDGSIEVVSTPVRPLRYINSQFHLPKENRMRKVFNDEWKPVLSFMFDAAKNLIVNVREEDMNAEFLETTFNTGRNRLEEKFPNLFAGKNRDKSRQWRVATWNKHIREERRKHGTI